MFVIALTIALAVIALSLPSLNALFADSDGGGREVLIVTIATLLGGAFQYVITQALAVWRERGARSEKQDKTIQDHLQTLIDRLDVENKEKDSDIDRLQEEIRKLIARATKRGVRASIMLAHIRYLERVLQGKQLSFERFEEEPELLEGSGPHLALPPHTPQMAPNQD